MHSPDNVEHIVQIYRKRSNISMIKHADDLVRHDFTPKVRKMKSDNVHIKRININYKIVYPEI